MPLEPPQLSFKISKTPTASWMKRHGEPSDIVLSLAPLKEDNKVELYLPHGEVHSWSYLEKNDYKLASFPSSFYDSVYLNQVLEEFDVEFQRKLLKEVMRVLKPGGVATALSKACNDAEEVYKLAKAHGFDTTEFENLRLTNKHIIMLRPQDAIFLTNLIIIPNRKRLVNFIKGFGFNEVTLEHLWKAGPKFITNRFYVGMKWQKE